MSVSGISNNPVDFLSKSIQNNMQQFKQEFQQLGQDLQAGNLSAAQADFVTLKQVGPQGLSTTTAQSSSPLAQAFQKLGQDLASGNISAAAQDYTKIQQAIQNQASRTQGHHGHHHSEGSASQLLDQLGQALQSGDISSAQKAYASLLQDFQQLGQSGTLSAESSASNSSGVSINA
jgi:murein L,D-transpeptidase YcbB/YkuD